MGEQSQTAQTFTILLVDEVLMKNYVLIKPERLKALSS